MKWNKLSDCVPAIGRNPNVRAVVYTDGKGICITWDYRFIDLGEQGGRHEYTFPVQMRTYPGGERYVSCYDEFTHWMYLDQSGFELP